MNKQLRGNIDNNGNGEVITLDDDREDEPMAEAGVKSASQDLVERLGLCVSDESGDEDDDKNRDIWVKNLLILIY